MTETAFVLWWQKDSYDDTYPEIHGVYLSRAAAEIARERAPRNDWLAEFSENYRHNRQYGVPQRGTIEWVTKRKTSEYSITETRLHS